MGSMRFLVCPPERLRDADAHRAFLASSDCVPWKCQVRYQKGELIIDRSVHESGTMHIPLFVPGHGQLYLHTGTLIERSDPYVLMVELARGKLNQVRHQVYDWQVAGMEPPDFVRARLEEARNQLARAATTQNDPARASVLAEESLIATLDAAEQLADAFATFSFSARKKNAKRLGAFFGVSMQHAPSEEISPLLRRALNTISIPFRWADVEPMQGEYAWGRTDRLVEWATKHSFKICGGPLLQLDQASLPDWLCLFDSKFETLAELAAEFVTKVMQRYAGAVSIWECAARLRSHSGLALTENEKDRLAVTALEAARKVDERVPVTLRLEQPWGEYISKSGHDMSPMHLADLLSRSDLGLSGIGLEINLGYSDPGQIPRDRIALGRFIDLWSCLGLPLYACICAPSASGADGKAALSAALPLEEAAIGGPNARSQADWFDRISRTLLSKVAIHGFLWTQYSDAEQHDFAYGGILDSNGKPKLILERMVHLRKSQLV